MSARRFVRAFLSFWVLWSCTNIADAAGGTSMVARKGEKAYIIPHWPDGVDAIINHPLRTSGWNPWFTEWPNDVNHYAIELTSTEELNELVRSLASTDSNVRELRLSYEKEPTGLGWVTRLPDGNQIPVVFSLGNQHQINEWYKRVRKPFGKMEFVAAPIAVPPTLTVYIRNKAIELDKIQIPKGVDLVVGGTPGVFHKANTKPGSAQPKLSDQQLREFLQKNLDAESFATFERLDAFVKSRERSPEPTPED